MTEVVAPDEARAALERIVSGLVGERLVGIRYSDVYNFGPELRVWDHGDWHHAVMGVEFMLGTGPASIIWTSTFHPYGVEVFREPLSNHLVLGPEGPEMWEAGDHPHWRERMKSPISNALLFWDRIVVGPAYRADGGERLSEADSVEVPVALRLEFAAGPLPVWFVSAVPKLSEPDDAFVHGDEIMVVFAADKMRRLGFPDGQFIATDGQP
ncbi:hypothetical protein [Kribbella sp. NPDC023855]|uniref:hypothetical protein n=1 Tax=Kribbella sp. NPDC023855 TaxID=3154698 RepID=UPI0033E2F0AE